MLLCVRFFVDCLDILVKFRLIWNISRNNLVLRLISLVNNFILSSKLWPGAPLLEIFLASDRCGNPGYLNTKFHKIRFSILTKFGLWLLKLELSFYYCFMVYVNRLRILNVNYKYIFENLKKDFRNIIL